MSTNDSEPQNENTDDLNPDAAADAAPSEENAQVDDLSAAVVGQGVVTSEAVASGGPAASATPAASSSASAAKPKVMTAGERLAAQKAAKAAQKVALRGREAEVVEQKAIDTAEETTRIARSWLETHAVQLAGIAAAVVAIVAVGAGVRWFLSRDDLKAGALLWKGAEAASAEIRTAEADPEAVDDGSLTFATPEARNRESLARFDRVVSTYPKTDAALFAHLGRAAVLLGDEKPAEARAEYEKVASAETERTFVTAQALEGIGVTYFEERDYAKAKQRFDELRTLDHERFRDVADYHLARVLTAQGEVEPAKTKLRALLEHLGEADAEKQPYVQQQAELLLQTLDPSTARRSTGGAGGLDLQNLPPELLQQLLRQGMQGGGQ